MFSVACATIGPPQPPTLELPKPPTDLRATRKGDRVNLTWTIPTMTTDRERVRTLGTTRICRGTEPQLTKCATVGNLPPAPQKSPAQTTTASYSDTLPLEMESNNPAARVTYAVEVLNPEGRSAGLSNQVRVSLVQTLPPPADFRAQVTGQGVLLSWVEEAPHPAPAPETRYLYRVYRRALGTQDWSVAAELPAGESRSSSVTDSGTEWEKTYEYRVDAVSAGGQEQVEGADSQQISVFVNDVFPPAVPSGLQAVFSGPGQKPFIDLIWAPVTDVDLDGYSVYRREEGSNPVKLNAAPLKTPSYRDTDVVSGRQYFYAVSAVDLRGNESAHSEETSENVPDVPPKQ